MKQYIEIHTYLKGTVKTDKYHSNNYLKTSISVIMIKSQINIRPICNRIFIITSMKDLYQQENIK